MTTAQKSKESKIKGYMKVDPMFRIPPVKRKVRYRKKSKQRQVIIEHRVGKDAGFFTREKLMSHLGLEKEYTSLSKRVVRKMSSTSDIDELTRSLYSKKKDVVNRYISEYRRYLNRFYEDQGLRVAFYFVPVRSKETGIYIQGLVDLETRELLVGDEFDHALANEQRFVKSKSIYNEHIDAIEDAKVLMLTSKDQDIKSRMKLIVSGKLNHIPALENGSK